MRCYTRLIGSSRDAVDKANEAMRARPDRWREEVLPLVRQPGGIRSNDARKAVKSRMQVDSEYQREEVIETDLVVNKKRFKVRLQKMV